MARQSTKAHTVYATKRADLEGTEVFEGLPGLILGILDLSLSTVEDLCELLGKPVEQPG